MSSKTIILNKYLIPISLKKWTKEYYKHEHWYCYCLVEYNNISALGMHGAAKKGINCKEHG